MKQVAILIPAAGRSSRMGGRDKLLEEVDGAALLRRQARLALGTGAPVLLTLPRDQPARRAALHGLKGLRLVEPDDAGEGISASVRVGAAWAAMIGAQGLMILLADMPELRAEDLSRMLQAFGATPRAALRATDTTGRPGHPVIVPARLFPELQHLRGDTGARSLLARQEVAEIALPGTRATTDLDTQEDWARWRKAKGQTPD